MVLHEQRGETDSVIAWIERSQRVATGSMGQNDWSQASQADGAPQTMPDLELKVSCGPV